MLFWLQFCFFVIVRVFALWLWNWMWFAWVLAVLDQTMLGHGYITPKEKIWRKEQALHLECTVEKCSPFKAWTVGVGQNIGMHASPSARMSYLFSVYFYLPCLFTFLFLPQNLFQLFNWNSFGWCSSFVDQQNNCIILPELCFIFSLVISWLVFYRIKLT